MLRSKSPWLISAILSVSIPAFAATLNVNQAACDPNDPETDPYCTIQFAVDNALDGDTILVAPGIYVENVIINAKSVTIIGAGIADPNDPNDPNATILDGDDLGSGFFIQGQLDWCDPMSEDPDEEVPPRDGVTRAPGEVPIGGRPALSMPSVTIRGMTIRNTYYKGGTGGPRFDGDDAVVLRNIGTNAVVDSIGQVGFDPGNQWGSGLTSTRNNTLRRTSVCTPDTDPTNAFSPSAGYSGFPLDDFTGLGFAPSCGVAPSTLIISEYVEGSEWNKAIEIYNPTGGTIDLSGYRIEVYQNGTSCPWQSIALTGNIGAGSVTTFKNASSTTVGETTFAYSDNLGHWFSGRSVQSEKAIVLLEDLEVRDAYSLGGGLLSNESGSLTANRVYVHGQEGYDGGVSSDWGTLSLNDSRLTDIPAASSCCRGGIYIIGGTAEIIGTEIDDADGSLGYGVPIKIEMADVLIRDSVISNNTNNQTRNAAAIHNDNGHLQIEGSTIAGNSMDLSSTHDPESYWGGAIHHNQFGTLEIGNSTISGNFMDGYGGAIFAEGDFSLDSVTLYDNDATLGGAHIWLRENATGDFDPDAPPGGDPTEDVDDREDEGYPCPECPSQLLNQLDPGGDPAQMAFRNTIIAEDPNNPAGVDLCGSTSDAGIFTSLGYNLTSDDTCGADDSTDQENTNPMLAALADNGGPTMTHAISTASPAFDNGSTDLGFDQRGVTRYQFGSVDIGAFELAGIAGIKTVAGDFKIDGVITYTIVLTNYLPLDHPDNPGNELEDTISPFLDVTNVSATSGTVVESPANFVTWNGSLTSGSSVTITIDAVVLQTAAGRRIENQASIHFDSDNNGTNDATSMTNAGAGVPGATSFLVVAPIPTLDLWAFLALMMAMAAAALVALKK